MKAYLLLALAVAAGWPIAVASQTPVMPAFPLPQVRVVTAPLPHYPVLPGDMGLSGTVRLGVAMSGTKVQRVNVIATPLVLPSVSDAVPRMFVDAAIKHVQSWTFEKHDATTFEVEYRYVIVQGWATSCEPPSDIVVMQLPSSVEVRHYKKPICDGGTFVRNVVTGQQWLESSPPEGRPQFLAGYESCRALDGVSIELHGRDWRTYAAVLEKRLMGDSSAALPIGAALEADERRVVGSLNSDAGAYWNGLTEVERIALLFGFLDCIDRHPKGERSFTRLTVHYLSRLNDWYDPHGVEYPTRRMLPIGRALLKWQAN